MRQIIQLKMLSYIRWFFYTYITNTVLILPTQKRRFYGTSTDFEMSLWVLDVVEITHHKYFPNTVHDIRFIQVIAFRVKSNVAWLSQSVHEIRRQMPIASFPSLTLIVLSKMNFMTFSYFCLPHRTSIFRITECDRGLLFPFVAFVHFRLWMR